MALASQSAFQCLSQFLLFSVKMFPSGFVLSGEERYLVLIIPKTARHLTILLCSPWTPWSWS